MDDAPVFTENTDFDAKRIRLADIDGSGVTDILYLDSDRVRYWLNQDMGAPLCSCRRALGR